MQQMINQAVQQAMMQQGGGGGAAGSGAAGLKPKIDVNVEIMQMKHLLAKICDSMGIHVPAQDMVATADKLNAMAQGQPTQSAGGGAQQGGSAIQPVQPMQAAAPGLAKQGRDVECQQGVAFDTSSFQSTGDRAAAIMAVLRAKK